MMLWNGKADNLIDRFDGRAFLDIIPKPGPIQPPSEDELELESHLNFERYVHFVHHITSKDDPRDVIDDVAAKIMKPFVTVRPDPNKKQQQQQQAPKHVSGVYSKVGLQYSHDGSTAPPPESKPESKPESDDDESSDEDSDDEFDGFDPSQDLDRQQEKDLNILATRFGIESFVRKFRADLRERTAERLRKEDLEKKANGPKRNRRERRRERDRERNRREREIARLGRARNSSESQRKVYRGSVKESRSESDNGSDSDSGIGAGGQQKIEFISEFNFSSAPSAENSRSFDLEIKAGPKSHSLTKSGDQNRGILEATKNEVLPISFSSGDRWQFSRAMDEKFNRKRYDTEEPKAKRGRKLSDDEDDEDEKLKKMILKAPEPEKPVVESPLERLRRKTQQQLNQKIRKDKIDEEKKEEEKREERRVERERERERERKEQIKRRRSRSPRGRSRSSSRSRSPRRRSRSRGRYSRRSRRSSSRSCSRSRSRSHSRGPRRRSSGSRRSRSRSPNPRQSSRK
eukprot:TRINITY_DN6595_c1_g1_i1.p1 TRINITY_DN6595_c1_g1~~TRINITY_DN6595_c1_g1_i1.p1  ORF type:complete len:579 (-),score=109.57 TRINITY_DN6595_c1_g1_i1:136-1683(-)